MFDYVRSSYDLGEQFTNVDCHTKNIEYGIGGTMTSYWIDPKGCLWYPDYVGTHIFEIIDKDDPRYNDKLSFLNFQWIPTGKHGRYKPHKITKYICIYPEMWDGPWEDWPTLKIHFIDGKIKDFKDITGKREERYI